MTQSVDELRRESERSRAELAGTVDRLREQISDTAEGIRLTFSPQHIKSEVSDYVGQKAQSWGEALKQQAMENPLRAIAVGTAVAAPVLRFTRGFSLPLLMVGAGLALTSKTVRDRAAEAAGPAMDRGREMLNDAAERMRALRDEVKGGLSSAQTETAAMAGSAQGTVAEVADDLRGRAAQATSTVSDKVRSGMNAAMDTAAAAKDVATAAPAKAREVIGDNAALVGGLGIAIGAIIAAALPQTRAEAKAMGQASDSVKQAAGDAAQSGLKAAKDATLSGADAAAKGISDADLGGRVSRMTQNMADELKEAASDAVTAAFNPPSNPNT